jgi:hypothetical protein
MSQADGGLHRDQGGDTLRPSALRLSFAGVNCPIHAGTEDTDDLDVAIGFSNQKDVAVLYDLLGIRHGCIRPATWNYRVGKFEEPEGDFVGTLSAIPAFLMQPDGIEIQLGFS